MNTPFSSCLTSAESSRPASNSYSDPGRSHILYLSPRISLELILIQSHLVFCFISLCMSAVLHQGKIQGFAKGVQEQPSQLQGGCGCTPAPSLPLHPNPPARAGATTDFLKFPKQMSIPAFPFILRGSPPLQSLLLSTLSRGRANVTAVPAHSSCPGTGLRWEQQQCGGLLLGPSRSRHGEPLLLSLP